MYSYDTIIVGLGAAGATAARALAAAGKRVVALEAQDRVGGRVCTTPFAGGVVELGAEWIHGTENSTVYDVAVSASVPLLEQELDMEVFRSDGSPDDSVLVNELINCALDAANHLPPGNMPLGDFIRGRVESYTKIHHPALFNNTAYMEQFFKFLNLLINNYEASNDWNDVTTASKFSDLEGPQHVSWHEKGYKTFFDIVLNTYKNGPGYPSLDIKLNTEVINIIWPESPSGRVRVLTKDGVVYDADNVIVTVSLGVLKASYKTLFTPPLPKNKMAAIETITFGVMDKIIFEFDAPWWPKTVSFFGFIWKEEDRNKLKKGEEWITQIFGASSPMGSKRALTLWTSGEAGKMIETLPEGIVKRNCLKLLRMFMGKSIPEPKRMIRSTWYTNPYTRGSYSQDSMQAAIMPEARSILAAPLIDQSGKPRVLFAGEATHFAHFSTVHGASETGLREAKRLLPGSKI